MIIINQALAKRFWPESDPLHDQIIVDKESPRQIIGVVGDVRDDTISRNLRPSLHELRRRRPTPG